MGEQLVGAYLEYIEGCTHVFYGARQAGGGLDGLGELDVLGLDLTRNRIYLCEVTTHIRGALYGDGSDATAARIRGKFERARKYADATLSQFSERRFMFWSPVVPSGTASRLSKISDVEMIVNNEYTDRIRQLIEKAGEVTSLPGNPAFRLLQILAHARGSRLQV